MKNLILLISIAICCILYACTREESSVNGDVAPDILVENYNDTGLNLTISPIGKSSTRSTGDTETFLIIIENPDGSEESSEFESILEIKQLGDSMVESTYTAIDGEILCTYVTDSNGNLIRVDVPDEYKSVAMNAPGWFKRWKECVKENFVKMMTIIYEDPTLRDISTAIKGISNNPLLPEMEVAVSAGIWCAKNN